MPHLLFKRLVTSQPSKAIFQALHPTLHSSQWGFSSHIIKTFSKIQLYSFSSFSQNTRPLRQTEYQQEELALLKDFEPEKNPEREKVMEKYVKYQDLTHADRILISEVFSDLAMAHICSGNQDKALKYLKEDEDFNHKAGIRETMNLATNFYAQGCIYLEQNNLKDAHYYLNESERICRLLEDSQEKRILILQCCCSLARICYLQNDQDKALELYNSILERVDDTLEEELPDVICSVSEGMGAIYVLRNDVEKTMEYWLKGLGTSTKFFGENSLETYEFSNRIADFLSHQEQSEKALPYAKQSLQIALQVFPKDHPQIAFSYSRLGHLEKDDTKALNSLKKAIQIFGKHPPQEVAHFLFSCYFQSARILALQNKPQEASNFLAKAGPFIALNFDGKELAEMYSKWAVELRELGNVMEDAKSYFLKAATIYESCEPPLDGPELAHIYAHLGIIAFNEQNWEKACELLKKAESYFAATETDPGETRVIFHYLTATSVNLIEVADGFKYAQKIIEYFEAGGDSEYVGEAHYHFGVLHKYEGRLIEALQAFKKSLEFSEMSPHGSKLTADAASKKITEIERKFKIGYEKKSEASEKIPQILRTFKNFSPKK